MATAAANITVGVALASDNSITRQDLEDAVEDAVVGDFTRAHAASSATIPSIGTSAPSSSPAHVKGELWVDTQSPTGAGGVDTEAHTLKSYNGTTFRPVNGWHVSLTAPTYGASEGMGWWDRTLDLFRIYGTTTGITGWHPIDNGFQLWTNAEASTSLTAGDVVIDTNVGTGTYRNASLPLAEKDGRVIGVAMETIAAGATGVIAMLGCNKAVLVKAFNTGGVVTIQNYLSSFGAADGRARSSGVHFLGNPNVTQGKRNHGVPYGAFAITMETPATGSSVTVLARLLGSIGTGAYQQMVPTEVLNLAGDMANANWTGAFGAFSDVDLTGSLVSARHSPIMAAEFQFQGIASNTDAGGTQNEITLDLSSDNATTGIQSTLFQSSASSSNTDFGVASSYMKCTTTAGSPYTAMGNFVYWRGTKTQVSGAGTLSVTAASLKLTGYWY